jgi:hypothetical protein
MQSRVIHNTPDFVVTSWGDGLAYGLAHKPSGQSVFFQGEDASQFRDELEALTERAPCLSYADALQAIWHDYEGVAA